VLLVAIEHGLVQAIYADVQVEKVGPGGSPDGEAD
jgi:hypothetical protein